MNNFRICIDYTLEVIETVPVNNNSNNEYDQVKVNEKKKNFIDLVHV